MKNLFKPISIIFLVVVYMASIAWAADTALNSMTNDASPTDDDIMYTVNDPSGTPADRKVTFSNLWAYIYSKITSVIGAAYDTAAELDALFAAKQDASTAATDTELSTHASSSDHDGRYYTETESDANFQPLDADLTTLSSPTAWRIFLSNGTSAVIEITLGASGTVLKSNGASAAPTFQTDATGAGGSAIIFDIGDDGGNDSTDVTEFATSGDTNSIFTEPSADKILVDLSNNWPGADLATTVTATANNTTDETVYPCFLDGATGSQGCETDTGWSYNPSTNIMTISGGISVPQNSTAAQYQDLYEDSDDGTNYHRVQGQAFAANRTSTLPDYNIGYLASDQVDSGGDLADGSVDAAHLGADVIDETKIADDGIDSEHYNDGSVDYAHLGATAKFQSIQVSDLSDATTPSVLTTAETVNKVISNYKSTGADHVFTLPAAHAAGNVIFQVGDEFQVDVEPPSGTSIYYNGTAAAADEHIINTTDTLLERMVCYCPYVNGAYVWACYSADNFAEATP